MLAPDPVPLWEMLEPGRAGCRSMGRVDKEQCGRSNAWGEAEGCTVPLNVSSKLLRTYVIPCLVCWPSDLILKYTLLVLLPHPSLVMENQSLSSFLPANRTLKALDRDFQ